MSQSRGEEPQAAAAPAADELARAVEEALSREREEFAQMLHDTVCQSMTGLQLMAGVLARKMAAHDPDHARQVNELKENIALAADELHTVERWLRADRAHAPKIADRGEP